MTQPNQDKRGVLLANSTEPTYDSLYSDGDRGGGGGGPFTPLFIDDFTSGTLGAGYPGWNSKSTYASDHPTVGGRSLKLALDPNTQANLDVAACAGDHFYGGRVDLPITIPVGKKIWLSMKRYIPTNFTFGFCYGSGDFAAATACSKSSDGNSWLKDIVFSPTTGGRIYIQPAASRRSITQAAGNRIISEVGPILNDEAGVSYPLGTWFTHQVEIYVHDTAAGYIREWIDTTLVNSVSGANVQAANNIKEWGIGDYWNGVPYTNGSATLHQWIRELIIATDVSGYGAPTGVDGGGRVYIDPTTTVAELS